MSAFATSTKKDAGSSESSKPSASKPQYFSVEAKIQKALGYKEKGNVSFKAKKYRKAIRMYHFMFAYITGLPGQSLSGEAGGMANFLQGVQGETEDPMSETESQQISDLLATANLNISSSYIQLKDSENALKFGKAALASDPNRWKAHLRKGQAYMMKKDFENAKEALECALSMQGGTEKYILKEMKRLKLLEKREDNIAKKRYKGMFEKLWKASLSTCVRIICVR